MAVTALRPNPRFQAFDLNGDPLAGGKLYTYSAGTTSALATYTDSTGTVANANPVILDSRGEASVWFQPLNYKLVLKDEDDNTIWTQDNYSGSPYPITDEWITYVHTWTYISATQVSVPGDQTAIYTTNKAIRAVCTAGTFYGTLTNAAYDGSTKTTLTVSFESGSFDAGVAGSSKISIGVQSTESPALTYATAAAASAADAEASAAAAAASAATIGTTAAFSDANPIVKGSADTTKQVRFEVDGLTPGATRVITMPDRDVYLGGIGNVSTTSGSANITLTSTSSGYQSIAMTAMGKHVSLPAANTMTVGGPLFILKNDGGYPFGIRDNAGTLVGAVAAGGIAYVTLKDAGSAAGSWSVIGDNLEPGLITIDSTFSSTYASTVLAPFVALDSNTSIHFAALSSGFAAFVVDNTGRAVSTPVTVSSTASDVPVQVFKITSTTAIVFYGQTGTATHKAVVLSLTGSSPSYSLSVGTPQTLTNAVSVAGWDGENFTGAPKIAQLSSALYLATLYNAGSTLGAVAVSVSGTTITIGSVASIGTTVIVSSQTVYALSATTALVLYKSGAAAPYANNAVVVSVSGTTCTVGTPAAATGCASSYTMVASSCLLSATKALIVDDNNGSNAIAAAVTVSGAAVTWGAAATVETGVGAGGYYGYTFSSATRYNPHLFPLSSSTALLWYLDSSGISRAVVLSESGGTVTPGTILYRSIKHNNNSHGDGCILPQGTSSGLILKNDAETGSGNTNKRALPYKISGTSITIGTAQDVTGLSIAASSPSAMQLPATRLTNGDYVFGVTTDTEAANTGIPVLRTNGDFVTGRGVISCPLLSEGVSAVPGVSSNRVVLLGTTKLSGTTVGASTYQLRLLNVEIAA